MSDSPQPQPITIRTGARLHFGPLACGARAGRAFGGIGLMVDAPAIELEVTPADSEEYVSCSPSAIARIEQVRSRWLADRTSPAEQFIARQPLCWRVVTPPVEHAGFGSGTQFSLAVAAALEQAAHGPQPLTSNTLSLAALAQLTGRGQRSAIGLHGFLHGGFLVDGGRPASSGIGTLAASGPVPEAWRFVLLRPAQGVVGLSGDGERAAFEALPPMSESLTNQLCRVTLMQILPALRSTAFDEFRDGIVEFGRLVGNYFAPVQGGTLASPAVRELAATIPQHARYFVQSSWGPTVAIPVTDSAAAEELVAELRQSLPSDNWTIEIARPLNCGAQLNGAQISRA